MALGDYVKGVPKPKTTSYSQLTNSPVPSSGTPLIAPPKPIAAAPYYGGTVPSPAAKQVTPTYSGPMYGNVGGAVSSIPNSAGGPITGGGMAAAQSAPRNPMTYDQFSDDMAATDSIFMDQKSAYANALKKFIEDNDRQKGIVQGDARIAREGVARNRQNGLTSLSEDFASRGLSSSGMFRKELDNAGGQYDKQRDQVDLGEKNAVDDLSFRRAKYEQENGEQGTNIQAARREAFARLAASQGLT